MGDISWTYSGVDVGGESRLGGECWTGPGVLLLCVYVETIQILRPPCFLK